VLILPPGHAKAAIAFRRFSRRERWVIGSALAGTAALLIAVVIAVALPGSNPRKGCIDVTIPYLFGGQRLSGCGVRARGFCESVNAPGGFGGVAGRDLTRACRKAGLHVGRSG
jgi:hypothetical protein